jgi:hypothetical protein
MNGEVNDRQVLCDIAKTAFAVVGRLLSRDQLLANELRSPETRSRQIYREECITVEMVTELRERFPGHVEITLFTPLEERRTGADWYWRFEKAGRAIHAHVQAKRVQRTEFGQPDAGGVVDLDRAQLKQLVRGSQTRPSALTELQTWLATYARFDEAAPPCNFSNPQLCSNHQHGAACANYGPSVWIAQAQEMLDVGRARMLVREVVERSLRLDCLLPCIDEPHVNSGPRRKGFIIKKGLNSYQDCISTIDTNAQLRKKFEGALRIVV